jgi:hypothetical protein
LHITEKEIARFWGKVDVRGEDECWEWTAKTRSRAGYGAMRISSMGRNVVASRISCILAHGLPPEGLKNSLHSCDNPPCCNPRHLRWGTQKHNVKDAQDRGRHINPPTVRDNPEWEARRLAAMPRGEAVANQTLTEAQAREIFRLHMAHNNVTQIASEVGAAKHVVADVVRGRSWRHLDNIPSVEELKTGGVRRGYNQFS